MPSATQPRLLGVVRSAHVAPDHRLAALDDLGEQVALEAEHACPGGITSSACAPGGRDHARHALLGEHDRHAVERHEPAQLADERAERLVEIERRVERPGATVGSVEQVGAAAELVAQRLGLLGAALDVLALEVDAADEPADEAAP